MREREKVVTEFDSFQNPARSHICSTRQDCKTAANSDHAQNRVDLKDQDDADVLLITQLRGEIYELKQKYPQLKKEKESKLE